MPEPRSHGVARVANFTVDDEGLAANRVTRAPRATGALPSILPSGAPGLQVSVRTVVASSASLPSLPSSTSRARRYDFGRAASKKRRVGPPKKRRELIQWGREIDARCAAAFGPQWALGWEAALVAHLGRDTA